MSFPRTALMAGFVALLGATGSMAADEAACNALPGPGKAAHLQVSDYAPVLQACAAGERHGFAIRTMRVGGAPALLMVDPQTLHTSVERQSCWTCAAADERAVGATRFGAAIEAARAAGGSRLGGARSDAGLVAAAGVGSVVTADLCPSHRPLDRGILSDIASRQKGAPVALAYTGAWLRTHRDDFAWLQQREKAGDLAITWVNHTDRHRYVPGVPADRNLMLLPGTNPQAEILDAERELIERGETPSVFFRFPGLVSTPDLSAVVARSHLIALGSAAWLFLGQRPKPGAVILVHANGNEPGGLAILSRLLAHEPGLFPLRPVADVP